MKGEKNKVGRIAVRKKKKKRRKKKREGEE